ncbi:MAG: hypothetical protein WBG67_14815 [Thermoanaerobaculia bacterium]
MDLDKENHEKDKLVEASDSQDAQFSQKEVAYYGALVSAWVTSKMERDKHLIAFAGGGLGLLLALLTLGGPRSLAELVLYGLAALAFLFTILSGLSIFTYNPHHLEEVAAGSDVRDINLDRLDRILIWSFVLGVLLAAALVITVAWVRYLENAV